ncbi:MAG: methyltransferase domain-containing protein [Bacteroidetes bacterium]|nr:methyltransferase domain-containing protein [Bacteroidota bacterium]
MDFSSRSYEKELLDRTDIPFEAIERNMHELDVINTYLGGHGITIDGLRQLINDKKEINICEIGCGGGDNLIAIQKWCAKKNILVKCIGIDINPDCISTAKSKADNGESDFIVSDYKEYIFDRKPDIIFSSLFCHHFTNDELILMLQWMQSNARTGFFINDLHRHMLAYHSIKFLTRLFSKSYLVKNDAPLSVRRGFIRRDWKDLLTMAEIDFYSIQWKWAFRWLIVCKNAEHASQAKIR